MWSVQGRGERIKTRTDAVTEEGDSRQACEGFVDYYGIFGVSVVPLLISPKVSKLEIEHAKVEGVVL